MAVYVDKPIYAYGRMKMCHMLADSFDELHGMADKIGVNRRWFQNKRTPHYDICKSKRVLAIQYGAVELSMVQMGELLRRHPWTEPPKE